MAAIRSQGVIEPLPTAQGSLWQIGLQVDQSLSTNSPGSGNSASR
jgi:hypothetical protein